MCLQQRQTKNKTHLYCLNVQRDGIFVSLFLFAGVVDAGVVGFDDVDDVQLMLFSKKNDHDHDNNHVLLLDDNFSWEEHSTLLL